ncbi:MAG: hypothetical protein NTY35_08465 [Planctomycetota bacterium]|nr:hypothetical protein [Planctomycetota bacterium]
MSNHRIACLYALVVLVLNTACVTSLQSQRTATSGSDWLEPSPALRQQIEDEAKRLPWTHGMERIESIHWFASVGEPAYPTLLAMVLDPRADVAGAALAALGSTKDSRLVESLRELPWPDADHSDLALERARTLLRLGDWQMVPHLVKGLRDERMMTRALCIQALDEATHERFGFDPRADVDARETAVKRWESWTKDRLSDPLLAQNPVSKPKSSTRSDD